MQVSLYRFSKMENSTKQPTGTAQEMECKLKDGCSANTPKIVFNFGTVNTPTGWNYVSIPLFNRFYYITDWTYENALWVATCKEDVLASFKTDIGLQSLYVTRNSGEYNLNVIDTTYPIKTEYTYLNRLATLDWSTVGGYYIVGIVNGSGENLGAVTYYIFIERQFKEFLKKVFTNTEWLGFNWEETYEVSEELMKTLFNPMQYITCCYWTPIAPTYTPNLLVNIGYWTISANGGIVTDTSIEKVWNFDNFTHPQKARGNYLQAEPYTTIQVIAPAFGIANVPASEFIGSNYMSVTLSVDIATGQATMGIHGVNGLFMQLQTQFTVPIALSSVSISGLNLALSTVTNGIGSIASMFGDSNAVKMFEMSASDIASAIATAGLKVESISTGGCKSIFKQITQIGFIIRCAYLADEDLTHRGRPLCANKQINTLTGYIVVADGDIDIACNDWEHEQIKNYLESGFYYE